MNKQFLKNLTILFIHKKMFMFFFLFSKSFPNDRINDIRARKLDFSLSLSLRCDTKKETGCNAEFDTMFYIGRIERKLMNEGSRRFDSRLTNDLRNLLCPNRCKRKYARPRSMFKASMGRTQPRITRETEIRTSMPLPPSSTTINFNRNFAYARKYT